MHFRDKCAAMGLDMSKKKVARAGKHINEADVRMIEKDYVDDGFGGGTNEDVLQPMGEQKDPIRDIVFEGMYLLSWHVEDST